MTEDELEAALYVTAVIDTGRFRGLSLEQLETRPEPEWVVYRVLAEDCLAMLEGVTTALKTFAAVAFGYSVATGQDWLGRPVKQGRVLYLLGEGSRGLPRRARAWQIVNLGGPQLVENIRFVVDQMPQLWKGDAAAVLACNPGEWLLIVVDTLARAMVGGDENQQKDMGLLIAGCEELRRQTGACILILHHLNAAGSSRGSTALPAGIHTQLRMSRETNSRIATLTIVKQKDDVSDPPITLVTRVVELGGVDAQGRPITSLVLDSLERAYSHQQPKLTPSELKTLAPLASSNLNFSDWHSQSGVALTTFRRARSRLLAIGYVAQEVAVYSISETGKNALTASKSHSTATQEMALGLTTATRGGTPIKGSPVAVGPAARPGGDGARP